VSTNGDPEKTEENEPKMLKDDVISRTFCTVLEAAEKVFIGTVSIRHIANAMSVPLLYNLLPGK
jgi:hypothetical protein